MNIEVAIKKACEELKKNKISSALLDSELLLSQVIKKDRKFILLNLDKKLDKSAQNSFRDLILKRSRGKPLAYLTGIKSFWKYDFDVNEKVLIPRPDTEIIIEQVLKIYKNKNYLNFLEVGVGSGCIALSILREKKSFSGTGIDLSQDCVEICRYNAKKLGVSNRIKLVKSDVDKLIFHKYDLIISNPPYIKKFDLNNFILLFTPSFFALYLHISIQSWLKSIPLPEKDFFSFKIESAMHPEPIPTSKKFR